MRLHKRLLALCALVLCASLLVSLSATTGGAGAQAGGETQPIPMLAYYYIWFNPTSWNRAKTDYPLIGRYSSDEQRVARRHIRWAKQAGIDGFIVSWKGTPALDQRLEALVDIARDERFKLAIIYQGLDFSREPLPVERVASDFDHFLEQYADDEVFGIFGKPAIIWSGTWRFSRRELAEVTRGRRGRLLILASERNADDYRRVQDLFDGDAYYWSSVNPDTFPGYAEKLQEMGRVVHSRAGLWIAPAAPGFDARLVGGTTVVPRADGATLRREIDAAFSSSPDAIGLISWNEFSENSHVEPSEEHGTRYLETLADINGSTFRAYADFDSSEPLGDGGSIAYGLPVLLGFVAFFVGGTLILRRRRSRAGLR
jgi:Glycosyl hydrolase family 71